MPKDPSTITVSQTVCPQDPPWLRYLHQPHVCCEDASIRPSCILPRSASGGNHDSLPIQDEPEGRY